MSVLSFLIQHKYNQESLVRIVFFLKTPVFKPIIASCAAWGVYNPEGNEFVSCDNNYQLAYCEQSCTIFSLLITENWEFKYDPNRLSKIPDSNVYRPVWSIVLRLFFQTVIRGE